MSTRITVLLLTLLITAASLVAFEPRQEHFASSNEWNLFLRWRESGEMNQFGSAKMSSRAIEMQWKSRSDHSAEIVLDLENGTVARLRERLPVNRPDDDRFAASIALAERFWFAVQARSAEAAFALMQAGLDVEWERLGEQSSIENALASLPEGHSQVLRVEGPSAEIVGDDLSLQLVIVLHEEERITLDLPTGQRAYDILLHTPTGAVTPPAQIDHRRRPLYEPGADGEAFEPLTPLPPEPFPTQTKAPIENTDDFTHAPQSASPVQPQQPFQPIGDVSRYKNESANLGEFVAATWDKSLSRRLLQNKVSNVRDFLLEEYSLNTYWNDLHAGVHIIDHGANEAGLGSCIRVRRQELPDGLNIIPDDSYTLDRNMLVFPDGELIDLTALSVEEAHALAPAFVQLTYLHRSLGTRLLDFLLLPDVVETTIVVKSEERQLYEPRNYFQSLLILSRWWQGRVVYFSIRDVKKVNNHVEFRGYILAQAKNGDSDYAEIRFHLNNDYQLDLAMMFLYPDIDTSNFDAVEKE